MAFVSNRIRCEVKSNRIKSNQIKKKLDFNEWYLFRHDDDDDDRQK